MPKYRTELFGQIIYGPEISYDGLLTLEEEIKAFITLELERAGAEFLSFESEGDRTFFQCAFQECGISVASALAARFKARMDANLESKLLFVDKMLAGQRFYAISQQDIREEAFRLPPAGPIEKSLLKG